jgi:hypothetical protein
MQVRKKALALSGPPRARTVDEEKPKDDSIDRNNGRRESAQRRDDAPEHRGLLCSFHGRGLVERRRDRPERGEDKDHEVSRLPPTLRLRASAAQVL